MSVHTVDIPQIRQTRILHALLAFFITWMIVFCGGFGAMSLLWAHDEQTAERGFYYYNAATWGDGLFLPIAAAAMVAYLVLVVPDAYQRTDARARIVIERICMICGLVAALVGAAMQISWVSSDTTILNWTIPTLHHFNFAGLYHAFYFMIMFGLNAYLLVRVFTVRLLASRSGHQDSPVALAFYVLMWFSGAGYLLMNQYDDNGLRLGDYGRVVPTLAILLGAIWLFSVLSILPAFAHADTRRAGIRTLFGDIGACIAGVMLAFGVSRLILEPDLSYSVTLFAYAFSLFALSLLQPRDQQARITVSYVFLLASAGFGFGMLLAGAPTTPWAIGCGITAILFLWLVARAQEECNLVLQVWVVICLAGVGLYGILTNETAGSWLTGLIGKEDVVSLIVGASRGLVAVCSVWMIRELFKECASEGDKAPLEERVRVIIEKRVMWVAVCSIFIGLIVMVLSLFIVQTDQSIASVSPRGWGGLGLCVILTCVLAILGNQHSHSAKWASIPLIVCLYICLIIYVSDLRRPVLYNTWEYYLLFSIVGASAFIANGLVSNMRTVIGEPRDALANVLGFVVWAGCASTFVFAVLPTRSSTQILLPSLVSPTIGLLGCLAGAVVPTLLAARIIRVTPTLQVLPDSGIDGVFQDSLMGAFMVAASGLFVIHCVLSEGWPWVIIVILIGVMGAGITAVEFTLKNNSEHLMGETNTKELFDNARKEYPDMKVHIDDEQRAFKNHLERQSWIVLFTVFPWSLWFLIHWLFSYLTSSRRERASLRRFLYQMYLLETSWHSGKNAREAEDEEHLNIAPEGGYPQGWWIRSVFKG